MCKEAGWEFIKWATSKEILRKEAMEKSFDCDAILILGDIFDTRLPGIGVWSRAIDLLSEASLKKSDAKIADTIGKDLSPITKKNLTGIPIISLHGNHERRGKDQTNIIRALEKAGILVHLHLNGIVLQKGKQKVAIQGMSSVPERYAKAIMDKWNPKPVDGCYNIILVHQSVDPFIYSPLDPPTLTISNLPKGFDLIVNGHIHTRNSAKIDGTNFIITGSTLVTQLKEEEAKNPKGFYKLSLPEKKLEFVELESSRKFFFLEIPIPEKKSLRDQVDIEVKKILSEKFPKKPIIKIRLTGKKSELIEKDLRSIEKHFEGKAIIRFSKKFEEEAEREESMEKIREEKLSLDEIGMELLKHNLAGLDFKNSFDQAVMFKLLSDNQTEAAYNIMLKRQASLKSFGG